MVPPARSTPEINMIISGREATQTRITPRIKFIIPQQKSLVTFTLRVNDTELLPAAYAILRELQLQMFDGPR